jgi:ABC-2 type transport system permease protein
VIARNGAKLLLSDPAPIVLMVIMPVILIAFLLPSYKAQLQAQGFARANGTEQLVPGMAVMFAFMSTMLVATLFYREHAWGTWERLRASSASSLDLVLGKIAPLALCLYLQTITVFAAGRLFFGYDPNGSTAGILLVAAALVATIAGFGLLLVSVFSTMDQTLVVGNLGGMLMSGIGGALAPTSTLPAWMQAISHAMPTYWAMSAFRDLTLAHATLGAVEGRIAILLAFALGFLAVALTQFKPSDAKIGTT